MGSLRQQIIAIGLSLFVVISAFASIEDLDPCGSFTRGAPLVGPVYRATFETDMESLIRKYFGRVPDSSKFEHPCAVAKELEAIIMDPSNRDTLVLHSTTMQKTNALVSLSRELGSVAKSIRECFGREGEDEDFLDSKTFTLGPAAPPGLLTFQDDIITYGKLYRHTRAHRKAGDQFIHVIENGEGYIIYEPFTEKQREKLINRAEKEIKILLEQLASLESEKKVELKVQIKDLKQSIKNSRKFREKIAKSRDVYSPEEAAGLRRKYKMNPEFIRRMISTYVVTRYCSLSKQGMPEQLLSIPLKVIENIARLNGH